MPLEREHLLPRLGLTVVVAEQVEEAVDGERTVSELAAEYGVCAPRAFTFTA